MAERKHLSKARLNSGYELAGASGAASSFPDATNEATARTDELLDEAIEETFPASDPLAVSSPDGR